MTDYGDPAWLRERIGRILDFYYPAGVDEEHGGYVAQLDEETGAVYDATTKHLVANARYAANFAVGEREGVRGWCADEAADAVEFLRGPFHDDARGGYHWLLDGATPVDSRRVCYGHAFVSLAYARALEVGVVGAETALESVTGLLDERFYEPERGLYRSEWDADWEVADGYRGQNANMHACEANLAAHRATGAERYLDRAATVAESLCVELAAETDGRIWEHYTADWTHDFERDDERDTRFRPWGYQPGHHAEWAKLLCLLDRRTDAEWPLRRARELFDYAVTAGWDGERGGFYYTVDGDGDPLDDDKYGWEVAEAIGAAAALRERTGEAAYREWYDDLWSYAENVLAAPGGNWYGRVSPDNEPYSTGDGPGVEPGYHPIGACVEALASLA